MQDVGFQNRVEACFHRGTQGLQTVDDLGVLFGAIGTSSFHIFKICRLVVIVKLAQRFVIQNGIGALGRYIGKTIAGGLDGHEAIFQLDGGVAAATLHIVGSAADGLRNSGKIG